MIITEPPLGPGDTGRFAVLDEDGAITRYGWRTLSEGVNGTLVELAWDAEPVPGIPVEAQTVVDGVFTPLPEEIALPILKRVRLAEIDTRTQALIAQGFAYDGKVFSLSLPAQSYWTNLYQARQLFTAMGGYPLRVNTLDDSSAYDVADEADAAGLYQAAVGTVKARLGSGTVLKDQVRAAATKADLDAIVDER